MRDIKLNNQDVLDALNDYKDWLYPKWLSGDMDRDLKINCKEHTRDRWLKDDYLQRQIAKGTKHEGFPESMRVYAGTMPDTKVEIHKERVCWHAASTDCLRMSVAYVFAEAESLHQDIIDDIEENW